MRGSPLDPGAGTTMWLPTVEWVSALKLILRLRRSIGGTLSSFSVSRVSRIKTGFGGSVMVVEVVVVVVKVEVGVDGKLCGSVGSEPASSSSRSYQPSSSRSMPMRTPEPGGTQV